MWYKRSYGYVKKPYFDANVQTNPNKLIRSSGFKLCHSPLYYNQNPLASSNFDRIYDALCYEQNELTLVAGKIRVNFNKTVLCFLSPLISRLVEENIRSGCCSIHDHIVICLPDQTYPVALEKLKIYLTCGMVKGISKMLMEPLEDLMLLLEFDKGILWDKKEPTAIVKDEYMENDLMPKTCVNSIIETVDIQKFPLGVNQIEDKINEDDQREDMNGRVEPVPVSVKVIRFPKLIAVDGTKKREKSQLLLGSRQPTPVELERISPMPQPASTERLSVESSMNTGESLVNRPESIRASKELPLFGVNEKITSSTPTPVSRESLSVEPWVNRDLEVSADIIKKLPVSKEGETSGLERLYSMPSPENILNRGRKRTRARKNIQVSKENSEEELAIEARINRKVKKKGDQPTFNMKKIYSRDCCDHCDYVETTKWSVASHVESKHLGIKHPCTHCHFSTTTKNNLARHVKSAHLGREYECKQCDYKTLRKQNIAQHVGSANLKIKHKCSQCAYITTTISNLARHVESAHLGRVHQCKQCKYIYATKGNLKRHVESAHLGREYECKQCDYKISFKSSLARHVKFKHL